MLFSAALFVQAMFIPGGICRRSGDAGLRVIVRSEGIWIDQIRDPAAFWYHEAEGWTCKFDALYGDPIIIDSSGSFWTQLGFAQYVGTCRTRTTVLLWVILVPGLVGGASLGRAAWR